MCNALRSKVSIEKVFKKAYLILLQKFRRKDAKMHSPPMIGGLALSFFPYSLSIPYSPFSIK